MDCLRPLQPMVPWQLCRRHTGDIEYQGAVLTSAVSLAYMLAAAAWLSLVRPIHCRFTAAADCGTPVKLWHQVRLTWCVCDSNLLLHYQPALTGVCAATQETVDAMAEDATWECAECELRK